MIKNIFHSTDRDKAPQIGIEIVSASITYSRCEFDTCQISFHSTDNEDDHEHGHTSVKYSNLVGDTCNWIFRENANFSIDGKMVFKMSCTFSGFDKNVLWCGSLILSPMDVIDEVQSFLLTPLPLNKYKNDDIFNNINEVVASISLRIYIPPIEKPIASVQVVVWQGKSINSKYPCYCVTGMLGSNNIDQQRHRSLARQNPSNPIFDFYSELDVFNVLNGDLVIEIWSQHSIRADKSLGQVIIPLSWIMSPGCVDGNNMHVDGWFELFPTTCRSRNNRYGQYRPYVRGIPLSTGYGLQRPDKPIGLIKIDVRLVLHGAVPRLPALPVPFTLYNAVTVDPYALDLSSDDDTGIAALLIAANNLKRIVTSMSDPPFIDAFHDIVEWRSHPLLTYVFLGLHTYTFLFAAGWQLPILFATFVALLGSVTVSRRNYTKGVQLYPNDVVQEDDEHRSLSEMYKSAKTTAVYVDRMVEFYAMNLERMNNLLTWQDPTATLAALSILFVGAGILSFSMKLLSPSMVLFLGGLSLFYPADVHRRTMLRFEHVKCEVLQILGYRSEVNEKKKAMTSDTEARSEFSSCEKRSKSETKAHNYHIQLQSHKISGFLYCEDWKKLIDSAASTTIVDASMVEDEDDMPELSNPYAFYTLADESSTDAHLFICNKNMPNRQKEKHANTTSNIQALPRTNTTSSVSVYDDDPMSDLSAWSPRWCEVWFGLHPCIKLTLSNREIRKYGIAHVDAEVASDKDDSGGSHGAVSTASNTPSKSSKTHAILLIDLKGTHVDVNSAGEVCLIDEPQKGSTNARSSMRSVMEGDMGMGLHMRNSGGGGGHSTRRKSIIEEITTDLCKTLYVTQLHFTPVKPLIFGNRLTPDKDSDDEVEYTNTETKKQSVYESGLRFGFLEISDQINWSDALSMGSKLRKDLVDEVHVMDTTTINRDSGAISKFLKRLLWQFLYMAPDDLQLQHRYICSLAKVQSDETDLRGYDNKLNPTCVRITVLSARGLPVKESAVKNAHGAVSSLGSTVYVQLQLKKSIDVISTFRTGRQPKTQNPAFREEFEFNDLEFSDTSYIQLDVIVKNSGIARVGVGEVKTVVGTITIKSTSLMEPPYVTTDSHTYTDWFTLSNSKTGAPVAAGDAALRLTIQVC